VEHNSFSFEGWTWRGDELNLKSSNPERRLKEGLRNRFVFRAESCKEGPPKMKILGLMFQEAGIQGGRKTVSSTALWSSKSPQGATGALL